MQDQALTINTAIFRRVTAACKRSMQGQLAKTTDTTKRGNLIAWMNAMQRASEWAVAEANAGRSITIAEGKLVLTSRSGRNCIYHTAADQCECPAFVLPTEAGDMAKPCWHRALYRLTERYLARLVQMAERGTLPMVQSELFVTVEQGKKEVTRVADRADCARLLRDFEWALMRDGS